MIFSSSKSLLITLLEVWFVARKYAFNPPKVHFLGVTTMFRPLIRFLHRSVRSSFYYVPSPVSYRRAMPHVRCLYVRDRIYTARPSNSIITNQ
jgi:hypothetical protein